MFTDGRSKRVLFLAHCALNQNAISDGTADYPGAHGDLLRLLLEQGVGLCSSPARNCGAWAWIGETPEVGRARWWWKTRESGGRCPGRRPRKRWMGWWKRFCARPGSTESTVSNWWGWWG